ncbi:MAG: hypothetical protein HYY18_06290 [Planctomycetes bacterium]|nr:hypothetical protein [Planctomycetota bacterium]
MRRSGAAAMICFSALLVRGEGDDRELARGFEWLRRVGDEWAGSGGAQRTLARYRGHEFNETIEVAVTPVKDSKGPSLDVRIGKAGLTLRRDLTRDEAGGTMEELAGVLPFFEAPPAIGPARIAAAGMHVTFADTGLVRTVRAGGESVRCAVIEARDSNGGATYFMIAPSGAAVESVSPARGLRVRPLAEGDAGGDLPVEPLPAPVQALAAAIRAARGTDEAALDAAFDFVALTECVSCNFRDLTPEQQRGAVATNRATVLDRFRNAELPASLPDDGIERGLALIVECEEQSAAATLRAPGLPDVGMRRNGERWVVVSLGAP